jgi:hypothetical protein
MGEIQGEGVIQHIWMTPTGPWRHFIFRIYWDGEATPSVESPVGDFFASGWGGYAQISSLAVCVNPGARSTPIGRCRSARASRSRWRTAASRSRRCTTRSTTRSPRARRRAYFHAQFRRVNPLPYKQVYTILDGVKGWGHYVGTYMAWGVRNNGWWGEGEIKFYLDGDAEFPTIAGTGTEDYFNGSYNFENPVTHQYQEFSTPYSGLSQVQRPDGLYKSQQRFSLYRWHIMDPVRFEKDLRVTIQALGWMAGRSGNDSRYLPLQDDIASVAFWYQREPHAPFPRLARSRLPRRELSDAPSGADEGRPPRLEAVEEQRAGGARLQALGTEPDPVDARGVVVEAAQRRRRSPVDPELKRAVRSPRRRRPPPVELDRVRRVRDVGERGADHGSPSVTACACTAYWPCRRAGRS